MVEIGVLGLGNLFETLVSGITRVFVYECVVSPVYLHKFEFLTFIPLR